MNARLLTVFVLAASITLFVVSQLQPVVYANHSVAVPGRSIDSKVVRNNSIVHEQNFQQPITSVSLIPAPNLVVSEEQPKLIGHIGGVPQAVFVRGNYAYVGYGPELAILDISNRTRPTRIGYVVFPDLVLDIYVVGSYAYVADKSAGVRIVDISNVAAPREVGSLDTSGECQSVEVVNNYAYIGDGTSGLRIMDISHPAHPAEVGVYDTPDEARKVTVSNGFAYIADNQAGLWIVNVTNPSTPSLVGSYDTRWYTADVVVIDHYAYVLDVHSGLIILDVSNPGAPSVLGGYNPGQVSEQLTVVDHYAYVFEAMNGLHVIDVANPHAPTPVGTYPLTEVYNGMVADGYAYLAQYYAGTITILDVSDPHLPLKIGSYNSPGLTWGIAVDDAHLYTHDATTLHVIDSADPMRLTPMGQLSSPLLPSWPMPVDVQNHYLYVGDDQGLHVFDATNPNVPNEIGNYALGGMRDFARIGRYLNIGGSGALRIVDTSVPISLTQVGIYPADGAGQVAGTGRYVYLMAYYGLHIVDILTPTAPSLTSIYTPSPYPMDVAEAKNFLYEIDIDPAQFRIVDVNNPLSPTLISSLALSGEPWQINVVGNYAYVTDRYRLWIIDVTNILSPTVAGTYNIQPPPNPYSTPLIEPDVVGQYIYLADHFYGIFVFQFRSAIAGYVTDVNFRPIADVPIESNMLPTVTTNASGAFAFGGVPTGTYSFTPTLDGYAFWPVSRTVTVPPDATNQNFVILPAPVSMTLTPSMTTAILQYTDTQGLLTQLDFSANVVTQTITMLLTPTIASPEAGFTFSGHAFDLAMMPIAHPQSAITSMTPVTVTVHYSDYDVRLSSSENELKLFWWNGNAWQDAAQTCEPASSYTRDVALNVLQVSVCRTGRFGLFGPTHQIFLPISFRSY